MNIPSCIIVRRCFGSIDGNDWRYENDCLRGGELIYNLLSVRTKHLHNICTTPAQRLQRWSSIVQMSYKCFVFTEITLT